MKRFAVCLLVVVLMSCRPQHPKTTMPGMSAAKAWQVVAAVSSPPRNVIPYQWATLGQRFLHHPRRGNETKLISWIKSNVSPLTHLPLSFQVKPSMKRSVYAKMGKPNTVAGIIERMIVEEGLVIYDGAVGQIALGLTGDRDDLKLAEKPIDVYWTGEVGDLSSIRSGYPINQFIYDPDHPEAVSSDLGDKGKRGFIFRIINAHGRYHGVDPLDGKKRFPGFPNWAGIHWEDWKPVAGENAWVVMAAMHLYHQKYFGDGRYAQVKESIEWRLAEELARAALILQADCGGIRMAPLGTFREAAGLSGLNGAPESWWYNQISTENNLSWYAALRMLYAVTEKPKYKRAMEKIARYFQRVWNPRENYFYQGMNFRDGQWHPNDEHFALDVQTWGIACLGPAKIDEWFGDGTSYRIWQSAKMRSGARDKSGRLVGVGYIEEHDRISVEWTAGAILAAHALVQFYAPTHPEWASEIDEDRLMMRQGIETLRMDLSAQETAYAYSSRRGWIPFGWFSHDPAVLSLASTGWVVFIDRGFNPFFLPSAANPSPETASDGKIAQTGIEKIVFPPSN